MPLTFRRAVAGDAAAIVALFDAPHARDTLHGPTLARALEDLDRADTFAFAIARGERLDGFVRLVRHEPWLAEITTLVAREPGAGTGWFGLREALRYAFEALGVHRTYLEVVATNARARKLYENAGFALEGTWREGYRRADGAYADLCAYGMLASEYRTPGPSRESGRDR